MNEHFDVHINVIILYVYSVDICQLHVIVIVSHSSMFWGSGPLQFVEFHAAGFLGTEEVFQDRRHQLHHRHLCSAHGTRVTSTDPR